MNIHKQKIHEIIVDNWETFPFKLDYIIHLLISKDYQIYRITFSLKDDIYSVCYINNINEENKKFNSGYFYIQKNELLNYLNINLFAYDDFLDFSYTSKIFKTDYQFRVQKSILLESSLISLRLLTPSGNFNEFNNTLENYLLFHHLNNDIPQKNIKPDHIKI